MTVEAPAPPAQPRLRRSLGLWSLSLSGVGIVLGAGIYVLVGEAAGKAGEDTWMAFLFAGLLASLTGYSLAELSAMYPESGASAAYAEEAFGPRMGFVAGWLDVTVNVIGSAAVAIGFAGYVVELIAIDVRIVALLLIVVCGVIIYRGVRQTVGIAAVLTIVEASGLLFVIAVGLPDVSLPGLVGAPEGWTGVIAATALVFFAYEGFEEIVSLAEETTTPASTVPRALFIAVTATSLLYVVVAAVATSVVPWQQLAESDAPLALVVRVATSDRAADGLSLLAIFSTFNTVLLLLATGARISYGMSARRLLPGILATLSRYQTPSVAVVVVGVLAAAFILIGDIAYVAQVTTFSVFGQFVIVNAALIRLRISRPQQPRPFRVRGTVREIPVTAALGLGVTLLLAVYMDRAALVSGIVGLLIGVGVSYIALRDATPDRGR